MRTISRDPYARTTLVRRTVPAPAQSCAWCGQFRSKVASTHTLHEYGTERDDRGGVAWHRGLFCCKGCHDDYHAR